MVVQDQATDQMESNNTAICINHLISSTIISNNSIDQRPSRSSTKLSILSNFHAGYFRITLSLSSQALLWKILTTQSSTWQIPIRIGRTIFLLLWSTSLVTLVVLSLLYLLRCFLRFQSVKAEFTHHIGVNYLFAPLVSALLLLQSSPSFLTPNTALYHILWWVFGLPVVALEVKIYGKWFTKGKKFLAMVANPTSQMSVIANMVCARAAAEMGWKEVGLCVFSFGFAHYLVLFVTLYQRFSDRISSELRPVFFLFFATPCFVCLAWSSVAGGFDVGSKMLLFLSLFLFASLISRPAFFKRPMKRFSLAWWALLKLTLAYSFPLTALAMASTLYSEEVKGIFPKYLMLMLLVVSVVVVFVLVVYTVLDSGAILPYDDPFEVPSDGLPFVSRFQEGRSGGGGDSSRGFSSGSSSDGGRSSNDIL